MPRDPIIGSGRKGFGFEQKGFQERNLENLINILSNKEVQKSIESLSKIDKDEWNAMAEATTQLNSFLSFGGIEEYTSRFSESIKETIKLQIESVLSPLQNEINQAIADLLNPFLNEILLPMINSLTTFLSENSQGAGVGGLVGAIAGLFLPGGVLWVIIGAVLGALAKEQPAEERWEDFLAWQRELTILLGSTTIATPTAGAAARWQAFQDWLANF